MSALLFETLVVSSQRRRTGRGRLSVPLSLGAHALGVGALMAVSLFPREDLPAAEPPSVKSDLLLEREPVRAAPTPAPARAAAPARASDARPAIAPPPTNAAPTSEPTALPSNDDERPFNPRAWFTTGEACPDCDGPAGVPTLGLGTALPGDGPPQVVRAGYEVTAPRKLRNVVPVYPDMAKRIGVEGTVVVECTIDVEGHIVNARVLSGHPLLVPAAREAVSQWTYVPSQLAGVPVAVLLTVTVNFSLKR